MLSFFRSGKIQNRGCWDGMGGQTVGHRLLLGTLIKISSWTFKLWWFPIWCHSINSDQYWLNYELISCGCNSRRKRKQRRLRCECSTEPLVKRSACSWGRKIHISVTWRWSSRCLRWWWGWRRRRRWWWWKCNRGPNWGLPKSEARLKTKIEKMRMKLKKHFFFGNITVFSDWWTQILH